MTAPAGPRVPPLTAVARAVRLRCPRCGAGDVLAGWFTLRPACGTCGLGLRSAPEADEWFGGYVVNFIAAELLTVLLSVGYVAWSWPSVPWERVEIVAVVLAVVVPVTTYPFAKMTWIALEVAFGERGAMPDRRRG